VCKEHGKGSVSVADPDPGSDAFLIHDPKQDFFCIPPLWLQLLDPESGMDKNQDPE
jgi:hypothetical protein